MKNLKNVMSVITLVLVMLTSLDVSAQKEFSKSELIDLSSINSNKTALEYKSNNYKIISLDIVKDQLGKTTILPNLENTPFEEVRIELYNGEKLVTSYDDNINTGNIKGGPNNNFNGFNKLNEPIITYVNSKEDWWQIVVAIVMCCVQAEIGYTHEGHYASIGFDCDCFSKTEGPISHEITIKGKKYDVTSMKFIPLNQRKLKSEDFSNSKNLSINLSK
ncbi:hypothetical protein Q4512_05535 [Oceanihabitans sp. 2_MG-2023]|uniref:hypothetical protein n=1 Tax=Oceanihabitans sp. 2_MG-2023 TaxID=3062661 RepID=UPI0026E20493|nr:hypothetical protein [Oceanihabitans sp. 2_MG-2023]MDO6596367.1 hypothetical protein [Oceanihabitans sp. 2_MG-2023]